MTANYILLFVSLLLETFQHTPKLSFLNLVLFWHVTQVIFRQGHQHITIVIVGFEVGDILPEWVVGVSGVCYCV